VDSRAEYIQLNVAYVAREIYKKKKLKQINAGAHLVQCRFKIHEVRNKSDYGGKDL